MIGVLHLVSFFYESISLGIFDITVAGMCQAGGAGGGAAAPPDFGGSKGAAGQRRRATLLPAPPDF